MNTPKYNPLDIVEYIIFIINKFATTFGLSEIQAYRYMKNFEAIEFVKENYGIMHTLDDRSSVESVANFCKRKGGQI